MKCLLIVIACTFAGCVESELVTCRDLTCPLGNVCTAGGCALPADVVTCAGLAEGTPCKAASGGDGSCVGGACQTGLCGNGAVDPGEVCDPGVIIDGQGCSADCSKIEICGDGVVDVSVAEQCDDGNHNPS